MSLAVELNNFSTAFFKTGPPDKTSVIAKTNTDFQEIYKRDQAIQVGQSFPDFHLKDASGKEVHSGDLLKKGPLLIFFYRGEWCPYCNLELAALQQYVDKFRAKGVDLVGISPEVPHRSLTTVEKHNLKFTILSDDGSELAQKLGIVFPQPHDVRPVYDAFGFDIEKRNGRNPYLFPVPATFLVDQKGVVRNSFIDPDFSKRLEPEMALEWVCALQK